MSLPIDDGMVGSSAQYDEVAMVPPVFPQSSQSHPLFVPRFEEKGRGRTGSDVVLEASPAYCSAVVETEEEEPLYL